MTASAGEFDPRRELAEIAGSLRALVEWQGACGTVGLPPSPPREALRADERADERAPPRAEERPNAPGYPRAEPPREIAAARPTAAYAPDAMLASPEPPLPAAERKARLSVLAQKVSGCTACVLSEKRTQTVFSRGDPCAELCFVGEGPGEDEDRLGEPFVGKAGQLLDKMIGAMGISRDDVYICNIVKCRPPQNRNPLPEEMTACAPYLAEQLELVRPKVMVTLGNVPLKALFGIDGITKLRGTWRVYKGSVPVMPTYHPAYVLRNPTPQVKGDVWKDLREVLRQLGRTLPQRNPT